MSFLSQFKKNKVSKVEQSPTDAEVVSQPQDEQPPVNEPQATPASEIHQEPAEQAQVPQQEASEVPEASTPGNTQETVEVTPEPANDAGQKIEVIPLGKDEISSLIKNGYDRIKGRFAKTFVIEKYFWARMQVANGSEAPTNQLVKVRRVAELKAANFMHALNLIGWDNRNVSLVTVKDEYDGGIAIKVDGKLVSSLKCAAELDGEQFMQMSGRMRRAHVDLIMSVALQDEKVVAIMNNPKNPRVVVGSGYEHNQHINIKTAKGKVAKA